MLERKKKKVVVCVLQLQVIIDIVFQIIELLNKETSSLIKVNKPNKKAVQSELSLLQLLIHAGKFPYQGYFRATKGVTNYMNY